MIPRGISRSPTVSRPRYCGFVVNPHLSILLDNSIASQGTKVLEDHEVRPRFQYATEDAPQRQAFRSVVRFTGAHSVPQWVDIERDKLETLQYICRSLHCSYSELKAQIGSTLSPVRRKGAKYCFQSPSCIRLEFLFRGDAIVVYGDPSDWTT
ncbi:hypothetical protein BDM02DRAFT_1001660 [Thelephora ganbajun]|uniref:Uncharacterized protein n=1 Tax=Thelephora ganbajun TaxID=370292 RepID=A0ACB6ZMD9_THEGA|nr:hypothetical protein BDM02DRAFT_1001660 [Thelephora ganbajun]